MIQLVVEVFYLLYLSN